MIQLQVWRIEKIGIWRDNEMNIKDFKWTREPDDYTLTDDKIEIITQQIGRASCRERV